MEYVVSATIMIEMLQLQVPQKYNGVIDLSPFSYVSDTPNDALQETLQEKVRTFNNSCLPLNDFFTKACDLHKISREKEWNDPVSIACRQYIRQTYLELFVYKEKLVRFVADIFHLGYNLLTIDLIKEIKKIANDNLFEEPFLNPFLEKINTIKLDSNYIEFEKIRNDEVHNISSIDKLVYRLEIVQGKLNIKSDKYERETIYFLNIAQSVLAELIEVKYIIQKIINEQELSSINKIYNIITIKNPQKL